MIENLNSVQKTIEYYHTMFLAERIGFDSLSKYDKKVLKEREYKPSKLKDDDWLTKAYKFGKICEEGNTGFHTGWDFKKFLKDSSGVKLNNEDNLVLETLKGSFYNDVKRIQNRVSDDINKEVLRLKRERRYYIRKKVKDKFLSKKEIDEKFLNNVTKYITEKSKDWSKHFALIVSFNQHSAYQNGIASRMFQEYGNDVRVIYKLHENCCDVCRKTLLFPSGQPRRFLLLDVVNNGDNIGKRKEEIRPVLAPIHVNCKCRIKIVNLKKLKENG